MSSPASPTTAAVESEISTVASAIAQALPIVQAIVTALAPEAAAAVATGVAIAKGVIGGVPEAMNLWNQFQLGTVPTAAQLQEYETQEQTAYQQVMADIQAKLSPAS